MKKQKKYTLTFEVNESELAFIRGTVGQIINDLEEDSKECQLAMKLYETLRKAEKGE